MGGTTGSSSSCRSWRPKSWFEWDKRARTHVYEAARTDRDTKQQLVTDLVDRAFGGSAAALVVQALSLGQASSEELDEI